ncbi:MAG TPA: endonuclease/exonuclease/phosphatase family protein [Chthoniobacteraceae bacterium]|jgi:endonuclease/exonuclease/phosphatase (EEP) superfamily protein YafD
MIFRLIRLLVTALGVIASAGTLLSFSKNPHWFVRMWDFPRVQIAAAAAFSGVLHRSMFFRGRFADWALLVANLLCISWHGKKILPYTPLWRQQVRKSRLRSPNPRAIRLLMSNVQMENKQHARLLKTIRETDPDVVLVVETDAAWAEALEILDADYPYGVKQPQENWYGMLLFSRLPLIDPRVEFLVQHDIPSVHTGIELRSGDRIYLHGIHPRPPEPIRDQHSTPRDAELVIIGQTIEENGDRPTIVAGDLNDVAWSPTSELFLRLSRLLDPRIGRGFYNSYNADHPLLRYPLDHVFHSNHFQLVLLRRLPHIGSDHYPMLVELAYEPAAKAAQPTPQPENGDQEEADAKIERQAEAASTGDDRPSE